MSPLCKSSKYNYNRKSKRPSPTKTAAFHLALDESNSYSRYLSRIKEISLFSSGIKVFAGMTVEAAIVLPLIMFFLLNLSSLMEMIRLHGNMELALTMVGNTISIYKGLEDAPPEEMAEKVADVALTRLYIQNELNQYLGEEYLRHSPLIGQGSSAYWGWNLRRQQDCVVIEFSYKVACPFPVPGFSEFNMSNQYYGHIWKGYTIPGTVTGEGLDTVFLSENAEVYHCKSDCTHLKLSVSRVSLTDALSGRNEDGERYVLCGRCQEEEYRGAVYITKTGDNYHYKSDCPGLKRTIYSATRAEVEALEMRMCSRCGGKQ